MARDFDAALAAADEALRARGMPRDAKVRLDARFQAPAPRRWPMVLVGAASVACGYLLVMAVVPQPVPTVGGFTVAAADASRVEISAEPAVQLSGDSTVRDPERGLTVRTLAATQLRKEKRGVRVLAGRATFEVKKVAPAQEPVRVLVSGGAIEVRGTRFTVTETGVGSGEVTLHEGRIDFVAPDGTQRTLQPGESLTWPQVAQAPSAAKVPPPAPDDDELVPLPLLRPVKTGELDWREFDRRIYSDAVINETRQLGRRGAWVGAVRLLERELSRGAPKTRERLSWELGVIYSSHLADRASACAHWAQHRKEYPRGRFDALVTEWQDNLNCDWL